MESVNTRPEVAITHRNDGGAIGLFSTTDLTLAQLFMFLHQECGLSLILNLGVFWTSVHDGARAHA